MGKNKGGKANGHILDEVKADVSYLYISMVKTTNEIDDKLYIVPTLYINLAISYTYA